MIFHIAIVDVVVAVVVCNTLFIFSIFSIISFLIGIELYKYSIFLLINAYRNIVFPITKGQRFVNMISTYG